jgi:predicted metal-dependent peptidase
VGEFITSVPCLYDSKFENKSSEEIYDILYENAEKINLSDLIDKLLDEHLDGEGDADGNDQDSDKPGKGRPKLSAEERQKIKDEIKEAMLAAAQASDAGSIPLGVKRMIQDLTDPKMNWRELLRMQLESTIKSDYTWMKTSRRGWDMDAVMPGMNRTDAIDIAVYIDMSGSIGEAQGKDFLSEVKGIMESFESYKIHIACFDTEVYNPQQYNSENLDLIEEYELAGGGGTDFDCIFRHLKDEQIEPKRLVVFTDGYPCGSWGEPNYCDTVWIIHGDKNPNPPFGTFALYEEDK